MKYRAVLLVGATIGPAIEEDLAGVVTEIRTAKPNCRIARSTQDTIGYVAGIGTNVGKGRIVQVKPAQHAGTEVPASDSESILADVVE